MCVRACNCVALHRVCICMCIYAGVRTWVHACVRACVRACLRRLQRTILPRLLTYLRDITGVLPRYTDCVFIVQLKVYAVLVSGQTSQRLNTIRGDSTWCNLQRLPPHASI